MLFTYVKIDEEVRACVREEIVIEKSQSLVSVAVEYEGLDMENAVLFAKIVSLSGKLKNKDGKLSPEEIQGIKTQIEKLENTIKKNNCVMEVLKPRWDYVVTTISACEKEHAKNNKNAVRNVLRLTACQKNSKFYKYVVVNGSDNELLYNAMERIHQVENLEIDENGKPADSENRKKDYELSTTEIGKIVKSLFSIPIESEMTKKVNIKFNKTDLAYIHALYVKSLHVRFTKRKNNGKETLEYSGRVLRTLISKKENKKEGTVTYDFTGFYEVICKLAIEYLVK